MNTMHGIALVVAGAALLPINSYVADAKDWELAHSAETVDPPVDTTVADPYAATL